MPVLVLILLVLVAVDIWPIQPFFALLYSLQPSNVGSLDCTELAPICEKNDVEPRPRFYTTMRIRRSLVGVIILTEVVRITAPGARFPSIDPLFRWLCVAQPTRLAWYPQGGAEWQVASVLGREHSRMSRSTETSSRIPQYGKGTRGHG